MSFMIALGIYAAVLFALAFVTRRRVGLLALALVAGAFLAELWASALVPVIAKAGVMIDASLLTIVLVLLPALVVMLRTAKAGSHVEAVFSAVVFALLATLLTYESFARITVFGASGSDSLGFILTYKSLLITICIVYAVFDVAAEHGHKARGKKTGRK